MMTTIATIIASAQATTVTCPVWLIQTRMWVSRGKKSISQHFKGKNQNKSE